MPAMIKPVFAEIAKQVEDMGHLPDENVIFSAKHIAASLPISNDHPVLRERMVAFAAVLVCAIERLDADHAARNPTYDEDVATNG